MKHLRSERRVLLLLPVFASLIFIGTGGFLAETQGHVGEGEAPWIVSHYESGNMVLTPDSSLPQWTTGPRMTSIMAADHVEMSIMSVNNGTYVIFLAERPLNTSISDAWMIIAFEGQGVNGSDQVWFWNSTAQGSTPLSGDVAVNERLTAQEFVVTFGRTFTPKNPSSFELTTGVPYDDFIKPTSWSNGTSLNDLNLDAIPHMGLEIFPYQDHYPKAPLVYGTTILVATFLLLFSEARKYRGA